MKKTWFITGATRGFGRVWAEAALKHGDRVTATARKLADKVTMVEPGAYATEFGKSAKIADVLEPYAEIRKQSMERLANLDRRDSQAPAEAILKLVDAEDPPLRFALGSQVLPGARRLYAERIAAWESWEDVSNAAQGQPMRPGAVT